MAGSSRDSLLTLEHRKPKTKPESKDVEIQIQIPDSEVNPFLGDHTDLDEDFVMVSSSERRSKVQVIAQWLADIPRAVIAGLAVPFAFLPIAKEASTLAGLNVPINEDIVGKIAGTLIGLNIKYVPDVLRHAGNGKAWVGLAKKGGVAVACLGITAGLVEILTRFHNATLNQDILSEDEFALAIIDASRTNPYARDMVWGGVSLITFRILSQLISGLVECCKPKPEALNASQYEPNLLQKCLNTGFKFFAAFSLTRAGTVVLTNYDQTFYAKHFLVPLSVPTNDFMMSGWHHLSKNHKPFESLVKPNETNNSLVINEEEGRQVAPRIRNEQKVAATSKILLSTTLAVGFGALAVWLVDYGRSKSDPHYRDQSPSFLQSLGEAILVYMVTIFFAHVFKNIVNKIASCRMFPSPNNHWQAAEQPDEKSKLLKRPQN